MQQLREAKPTRWAETPWIFYASVLSNAAVYLWFLRGNLWILIERNTNPAYEWGINDPWNSYDMYTIFVLVYCLSALPALLVRKRHAYIYALLATSYIFYRYLNVHILAIWLIDLDGLWSFVQMRPHYPLLVVSSIVSSVLLLSPDVRMQYSWSRSVVGPLVAWIVLSATLLLAYWLVPSTGPYWLIHASLHTVVVIVACLFLARGNVEFTPFTPLDGKANG